MPCAMTNGSVYQVFDESGRLVEEDQRQVIAALGAKLTSFTRKLL